MTSREIIKRVLAFDNPERIGLTFSPYKGEARTSDLWGGGPSADPNYQAQEWTEGRYQCSRDEWGNVWAKVDERHCGEVIRGVIQSWDDLDDYQLPPLDDPTRYETVKAHWAQNDDHYRLGTFPGFAFNVTRYMRGFEQFLLDCAADPTQVRRLNDTVVALVERVIDLYADAGADGIFTCEDWGTQERLLVSPAMWREIFLPSFERVVARAHSRGVAVWMHSCGYLWEIIPDLIAVGVDVLQFDQQENYPLTRLAEAHAGKVTFWCPVDIQKVLQTQDKATIQAYAKRMRELLGGHGGGFIAKDYSDWRALGLTEDEQQWAYEAFLEVAAY
ncbi:MAG: uroporphyrinogen decarboxylase family protein [Armatimonadota bacterium]